MKRIIFGALAVTAVMVSLRVSTPAEAAPTEVREPYGTHRVMEDGTTKYYLDPDKQYDEKVIKVWINRHRARRINDHRWVHRHNSVLDNWLHVKIKTTERTWSAWVHFNQVDTPLI